jgi:hypothetical protein
MCLALGSLTADLMALWGVLYAVSQYDSTAPTAISGASLCTPLADEDISSFVVDDMDHKKQGFMQRLRNCHRTVKGKWIRSCMCGM